MSTALTSAELDKLVRVLGLLSSNHDGERATAGLMASKMLRDRGLAWTDILQPVQIGAYQPRPMRTPRPPTTPAASYAAWTNYLLRNTAFLTEWERGLVTSAATRGRLTDKQVSALREIYTRVVAREAGS